VAKENNMNDIEQLRETLTTLKFSEVMAIIDALYNFRPTEFTNGGTHNEADQNNGSCKLFAFAQLNEFTEPQTLALFAEYYRDVLATPNGVDHQNIRHFMMTGWSGISFSELPLTPKS
jgi:hypothetical protein